VGNPFANWSLVCNSAFGGGKQMSDEELILQYDQKFWELVYDKGYSYRKARRILKKKYPSVYYDVQKDKWFINNVVMGTAIFPEKKYIVHDKITGQYIYYNWNSLAYAGGNSKQKYQRKIPKRNG